MVLHQAIIIVELGFTALNTHQTVSSAISYLQQEREYGPYRKHYDKNCARPDFHIHLQFSTVYYTDTKIPFLTLPLPLPLLLSLLFDATFDFKDDVM